MIEVGLELGERVGGLFGEEILECLVEAFDLPAGLGVVGPGMLRGDGEGLEECFEDDFAASVFGGVDAAVVGEQTGGRAPAGGGVEKDLGDVGCFGDRQNVQRRGIYGCGHR